jgi:hypothetical protein
MKGKVMASIMAIFIRMPRTEKIFSGQRLPGLVMVLRFLPGLLIMDPLTPQPELYEGKEPYKNKHDYPRGGGNPDFGKFEGVLINIVDQGVGRIDRPALGHDAHRVKDTEGIDGGYHGGKEYGR